MSLSLYQLDKSLKNFLIAFLVVLTLGVLVGLTFLWYTTDYTPEGAIERFKGSEAVDGEMTDEFAIPESYPKPVSELLITTHNHIISFSFIFVLLGIIFYFNSVISGFWKSFLLIEPFVSTIVSFGSIWGMRFIHNSFIYFAVISALLIYTSFFIMISICLYELIFKKEKNE